jgi:hypothetical protein
MNSLSFKVRVYEFTLESGIVGRLVIRSTTRDTIVYQLSCTTDDPRMGFMSELSLFAIYLFIYCLIESGPVILWIFPTSLKYVQTCFGAF